MLAAISQADLIILVLILVAVALAVWIIKAVR